MEFTSSVLINKPKENEIVTIKCKCSVHSDSWFLHEYPLTIKGNPQSFHEEDLFPLEEVFSEQSQEDIERIESEIEQEQLITVTP